MATYQLISSVTVGAGGASSIDFTSIPATYTDLVIKFSNRTNNTGSGNGFSITLNSSSTGYTRRSIYGDGSAAASNSGSTNSFGWVDGTTETANTFANVEIYIPNYAGSNYKSLSNDAVMENNATAAYSQLAAMLWSNTAAITSISLTPGVGSWVQYTNAYLYGIKNS